jgi:hypothetical protein
MAKLERVSVYAGMRGDEKTYFTLEAKVGDQSINIERDSEQGDEHFDAFLVLVQQYVDDTVMRELNAMTEEQTTEKPPEE